MRKRFPHRAFLLLSLLIVGLPAAAQGEPIGKAILLSLRDYSGTESTREFEATLTEAVQAAFEAQGAFQLVSPSDARQAAAKRSVSPDDLGDGPSAAAFARSLGADLAILCSYVVSPGDGGDDIFLSVECWDARTLALTAGFQRAARFDLGFYLFLQEWIASLVPTITVSAESTPAAAPVAGTEAPATSRDITFVSRDEGMEVLLAGGTSLGTVADGALTATLGALPDGTLLQVTKRKDGFHDAVQQVKVAPTVTLTPLSKTSTVAAELDWTTGQMLGAGGAVRGYLVADQLFGSLRAYAWVQPPATLAARAAFHVEVAASLETYVLLPPDAPVRLTLGTGAGVAVTALTQAGFPVFTDFYLDVVTCGVETSILGPTLFLRSAARYALGLSEHLVPRGWPLVGSLPPTTLGVLFRW